MTLFPRDEQYKNSKTKIRCFTGREYIPSVSVIFDLGHKIYEKYFKNLLLYSYPRGGGRAGAQMWSVSCERPDMLPAGSIHYACVDQFETDRARGSGMINDI